MSNKPAAVLLLATCLWLTFAGGALAQTPTPNEVNKIARELWCPLCNGVRLDNCELQACVQMKEVIAQKLEAGESDQEIREYFIEQYGDVVLGAPSNQGFSRLAWGLPVLAAVVGLGWLAYFIRSTTRKRPVEPPSKPSSADEANDATQDDYLQRVDEELDRYL